MNDKIDRLIRYTTIGIISILTFIYFWFLIDPSIIHFNQQPLFLLNKYFLSEYLSYPGGIAEYFSLFFTQFFYSKLLGSIILIAILSTICFLVYKLLLNFFSNKTSFYLQLIPGLVLVHLHSHYSYDLRGDFIFMASISGAILYNMLFTNSLFKKVIYIFITSIVLFIFFGGTSLLLYSLIVILTEIYDRKFDMFWLVIILQISICCLLIYIVTITSAHVNFAMASQGILHSETHYKPLFMLYVLFGFIPVILIFKTLFKKTLQLNAIYEGYKNNLPTKRNIISSIIIPVIFIGLLILVFKFSFNKTSKNSVAIHKLAKSEQWEKVLEIAKELPPDDRTVIFQANRALYHLGKLNDEAFGIVQYWGENGLILTRHYTRKVLMHISDLYFDMGHIKESLHWAYEAQTIYNNNPDVLERIIINNIILGEYKAANKFLQILSKSIVHKKWTKRYFEFLNNEELIKEDQLLNAKRKLMPKKDFYAYTQKPENDLQNLFFADPPNKMAFEYYMLNALLKHDLAGMVIYLKYLEKLNYKRIPRHIEEGILLFKAFNTDYNIDLGKYQISENTKKAFIDYSKIMLKHKHNQKAAQYELYKKYKNTYWYYILYISPITNKREIQVRKL